MSESPARRRRIAVVAAVLQRSDGSFLLAQRPAGKAYAGYWEFPGGKVEDGEVPRDAISRELHEELGIEVITAYPWIIRDFDYPHADVRLHFFRVRAWHGELQSLEAQAFSWQRLDTISVAPLLPANDPILRALGIPEVYGITGFAPADYPNALNRINDALNRGLSLIQVRGKDWPPALFEQYAHEIVGRAHACGARVVINMDVGLARRCGADGVHLTAAQLREYGSRPDAALVGVSCHSAEELRKAEALDADFAVLGPVLPTPTHPGAQLLGWTGLAQHAANARIPVFALGGVQPDDLQQALCCGAHGIAMVRGAWGPGASLV